MEVDRNMLSPGSSDGEVSVKSEVPSPPPSPGERYDDSSLGLPSTEGASSSESERHTSEPLAGVETRAGGSEGNSSQAAFLPPVPGVEDDLQGVGFAEILPCPLTLRNYSNTVGCRLRLLYTIRDSRGEDWHLYLMVGKCRQHNYDAQILTTPLITGEHGAVLDPVAPMCFVAAVHLPIRRAVILHEFGGVRGVGELNTSWEKLSSPHVFSIKGWSSPYQHLVARSVNQEYFLVYAQH